MRRVTTDGARAYVREVPSAGTLRMLSPDGVVPLDSKVGPLLFVVLAMIVILALAGLVLAYAVWIFRGPSIRTEHPAAQWVGRAMNGVANLDPALRPEPEAAADRDAEHV